MGVKVKSNFRRAKERFSGNNIDRTRYAVASQVLSDMNQFVPALDYNLRNQTTISQDGRTITYNAPYAAYQFYNQFANYTTAGTGSRWDLKATGMFISDWVNVVRRGL